MPTIMYSIYVGNYENPSNAKSDIAKLNELGLKAYIFSRGDHFALKVFASTNLEKALLTKAALIKRGYIVEFEELDLNKSLHV